MTGVVGDLIGELRDAIIRIAAGIDSRIKRKTAVFVQGELPERGGGVELGGERIVGDIKIVIENVASEDFINRRPPSFLLVQ